LLQSRGVYKVDGGIHEQTNTCAITQYYANEIQKREGHGHGHVTYTSGQMHA
jgi:hypothetical protein